MVSVIIPNYNHACFLQQRIDTILAQTYQDFEVIILDDCSTDRSKDVIESYRSHPKVSHIIYNTVNTGSTFKQWEKGLGIATGKYIWIAESDDYCDENFLEEACSNLHSGFDFFYCKSRYVDKKGKEVSDYDFWLHELDPFKWKNDFNAPMKLENKNFLYFKNVVLNTSSVVFKADRLNDRLLTELANFKYTGDWYLWIHYFNAEGSVAYSTKTNNYFRITTTSTSKAFKNPFIWNNEIFKILQTILAQLKHDKSKRQEVLAYFILNYISKGSIRHPKLLFSSRLRQNYLKAKHQLL